MDDKRTDSTIYAAVKMVCDALTDMELAAINNVAQWGVDPGVKTINRRHFFKTAAAAIGTWALSRLPVFEPVADEIAVRIGRGSHKILDNLGMCIIPFFYIGNKLVPPRFADGEWHVFSDEISVFYKDGAWYVSDVSWPSGMLLKFEPADNSNIIKTERVTNAKWDWDDDIALPFSFDATVGNPSFS